jgi:hypothetical protein
MFSLRLMLTPFIALLLTLSFLGVGAPVYGETPIKPAPLLATSSASSTIPNDAVVQQAIQKYREGHYDETLLLLSSLPDALRQNPYVAYYQALSYDLKDNLNKAKAAYENVITLAAQGTQVRGCAEKRLQALNAVLDLPSDAIPSEQAIQQARSETLANNTKRSKKELKNEQKLTQQHSEASSSSKDIPAQAAMAVATVPSTLIPVNAQVNNHVSNSVPASAATPPQMNQQLLQTMLLMQAMGGNGGGNGMQGSGGGGGINPLLLMSLMGGGMPGMTSNPQQPADPNAPSQGPQGMNPALMQSMLMDQMMQQMDFSSGRNDQDR